MQHALHRIDWVRSKIGKRAIALQATERFLQQRAARQDLHLS
jgi:hypothetical protein